MSQNDSPFLNYSLDDYFKSTNLGSIRQSITNNLYGINHRQTPGMVPDSKETYGYTFFVRPQLNLTSDNISNIRLMFPLLTSNPDSLYTFVRNTLDPRLKYISNMDNVSLKDPTTVESNICDNYNPFIPVLTNNLNSLSGWDDLILPTNTSEEGLYSESYSIGDGFLVNYKSYDLDATFRNTRGDPIMYLFYIWQLYISHVYEGSMMPYLDFVTENEIDYNTRIYRLVLDQTKTYVRKIACTGAAFPITLPIGGFFDFSNDKPYNDQVKDFTIRFRCMGIIYNDQMIIHDFNKVTGYFNPAMKELNELGYSADIVKVERYLLPFFNNRGYPRINPDNNELEWWVDSNLYQSVLSSLVNNKDITANYDLLKSASSQRVSNQKRPIPSPTTGGYADNIANLGKDNVDKKS